METILFLGYIDPGSGFTIFTLGGWLAALALGLLSVFLYFFKTLFGFFRKKNVIIILLIIISISALIVGGTIMQRKVSGFNGKLVILGFDGLDPRIMEPLMAKGELPNFKRLGEEGSYRRLSTTNPAQSPVAWAGFATGTNPGKSGVFDFIKRNPRDYSLDMAISAMRNGKPAHVIKNRCFWEYASDVNINSVIIGCPLTFPPYKTRGRMLSGMGVPDILGTEGTFSFYTTEPPSYKKDTAGNVFYAKGDREIAFDIIGPKISGLSGAMGNARIPFKVRPDEKGDYAIVEFQDKRVDLKKGRWSPWQEVVFKAGPFKNIRGIFKFYLTEVSPRFKLYMSPVNFDPRKPLFPISYPGDYSKYLSGSIGLYHTRGMPADTWAVNEGRLTEDAFLEQADEILKEKESVLNYEMGRFRHGILFCYFGSPDFIQHIFWRYTDTKHPLYEKDAPRMHRDAIRAWYKKMDRILGDVMNSLTSDDTLIALSDHGFDSFSRAANVNSWLRKNGYLRLKDAKAGSGAELLRDIDWDATKAYAIGFGSIYINQRGREGLGIVNPGEETESLKRELSRNLKAWIDNDRLCPVVNNVYLKEEIFRGRFTGEAPDLVIGFKAGYRASWQTALGAVPAPLLEDNKKKWSGDHLFDPCLVPGVFFSNRQIKKDAPSIYDIAPTILKLAGFDDRDLKACDMDGEPLI